MPADRNKLDITLPLAPPPLRFTLLFYIATALLYLALIHLLRLLGRRGPPVKPAAAAMVTSTAVAMPDEKEAPEFTGTIRVSQKPPSKQDLERVADITCYSSKREPVPFGSLYSHDPSRRTLLLFVRHFFCGNCQEYVKTLCSSITPKVLEGLEVPTDIVIIGCGQPDLIDFYAETTACPYPIYAEPTKRIYAELGMARTLDLGPSRPDYMQKPLASLMLNSMGQVLSSGRKAFKGGDYWQVGGEFLLQGDEVFYCHRMSNTRDHAEVPEIRKQLDLSEEAIPDRRRKWSPLRKKSRSRSRTRTSEANDVQEKMAENRVKVEIQAA